MQMSHIPNTLHYAKINKIRMKYNLFPHCTQILGTREVIAMSNPLSPLHENLFMNKFETEMKKV